MAKESNWEKILRLRGISTTKQTFETNDRNIRAVNPHASEEEIMEKIIRNLKANPEYNR